MREMSGVVPKNFSAARIYVYAVEFRIGLSNGVFIFPDGAILGFDTVSLHTEFLEKLAGAGWRHAPIMRLYFCPQPQTG